MYLAGRARPRAFISKAEYVTWCMTHIDKLGNARLRSVTPALLSTLATIVGMFVPRLPEGDRPFLVMLNPAVTVPY
jgi:hypothetical protein